jgi:hypothetical protein
MTGAERLEMNQTADEISDAVRAQIARINELERGYFYRRRTVGRNDHTDNLVLDKIAKRLLSIADDLRNYTDYQGNLRSTATVIKGWKAGVDVERIRVVTYNHCRDRAFEYLNGVSFLETVKGKKIRSFYLNILNPMDPEPVTIDGHAVNIWRGRRMNLKEVAGPKGRFNYNEVARDYRSAAIRVGLLPNQVQAITWFTWKRVHSILFPGRQLELLRDNSADLWRTIVDPESIVPFEFLANPSPSHLPARRIRDPRQTAKIQNGKRKTETRA